MRVILLAAAALLTAGCEELRPQPSASQRAATACQKAGIAPGSPGYTDCFTRAFDTVARADAQIASRPVMMPAAPQIAPMQFAPVAQPARLQTTCMPYGGGMVSCF